MKFELRAITREDMPFLLHLYGTTREEELALTNFSDQEKDVFILQQFEAQHTTYTVRYPRARFDLIVKNGLPIGRLYVDRREKEIRIMDVALLPEWRGQGIGSFLMGKLLDEGRAAGLPVCLHVEQNNPRAFAWYQRLGFAPVSNNDTHVFMAWSEGLT
jgi:ribosomal protein S18 acetylase RimI-like enzyme